jgi:hypothetical protein
MKTAYRTCKGFLTGRLSVANRVKPFATRLRSPGLRYVATDATKTTDPYGRPSSNNEIQMQLLGNYNRIYPSVNEVYLPNKRQYVAAANIHTPPPQYNSYKF